MYFLADHAKKAIFTYNTTEESVQQVSNHVTYWGVICSTRAFYFSIQPIKAS